jgi:ABC-type proline/glycine betaine transport system permease subunit
MLSGAVPAALLALLLQWLFDAIERRLQHQGARADPDAN